MNHQRDTGTLLRRRQELVSRLQDSSIGVHEREVLNRSLSDVDAKIKKARQK